MFTFEDIKWFITLTGVIAINYGVMRAGQMKLEESLKLLWKKFDEHKDITIQHGQEIAVLKDRNERSVTATMTKGTTT